jgi:EmrB/QacA subfamily drug resistance transporter
MGNLISGRNHGEGRAPAVLVLLCIAPFVAVLDTTIMTIALPSIGREMNFSPATIQWVITSYSLSLGGLLLLGGRLGDVLGRKRILLCGFALLGVASLAGGLASTSLWLVVARAAQGAGAAGFVPCSLSLITATFTEERDRNRAMATFGATVGVGFVTAMLVGGVLTTWFGWRSVLLINVPIAIVTVALGQKLLEESRDPKSSGRLDAFGALTVTVGLGAMIYALSEGTRLGWSSLQTMGSLIGGTFLLAVFAVHERRTTEPLLPLSILRRPRSTAAYQIAAFRSMFGLGLIFTLTLFFQDVRSFNAFQTGLLFTPMAVVAVLVAPLAGHLSTRLGIRLTLVAGLLVMLVGAGLVLQISVDSSLIWVLTGMVVSESGFILSEVPTTIAGAAGLGKERGGLAAGLLGTSQQLGHALGLALIGTVISVVLGSAGTAQVELLTHALKWGLVVIVAAALVALVMTLRWLPSHIPTESSKVDS